MNCKSPIMDMINNFSQIKQVKLPLSNHRGGIFAAAKNRGDHDL